MKKFITFIICLLTLTSCIPDRISHEDANYIYVWKFNSDTDSVLAKYSKPRIVELKVVGGRRKYRKLQIIGTDGCRHSIQIPNNKDKYRIIKKAQEYAWKNKTLIGEFKESFYPYYKLEFIRYKN